MLFISSSKLLLFSRYLSFYHDFWVMLKKQLDLKDKVNFKIHDVKKQLQYSYFPISHEIKTTRP